MKNILIFIINNYIYLNIITEMCHSFELFFFIVILFFFHSFNIHPEEKYNIF